jgi:hypothetical protein
LIERIWRSLPPPTTPVSPWGRRLASQALASGALVMPFPDMAVRCEPRYYLATSSSPVSQDPGIHPLDTGSGASGHPETGPGLLSAKVMAMSALFVQ